MTDDFKNRVELMFGGGAVVGTLFSKLGPVLLEMLLKALESRHNGVLPVATDERIAVFLPFLTDLIAKYGPGLVEQLATYVASTGWSGKLLASLIRNLGPELLTKLVEFIKTTEGQAALVQVVQSEQLKSV